MKSHKQILDALREVGGKYWADQIEKCEFFDKGKTEEERIRYQNSNLYNTEIKIDEKKKLDIENPWCCIMGEIRCGLNEKKFDKMTNNSGTIYNYGCQECDQISSDLMTILESNDFKKTKSWWHTLNIAVTHVKLDHPPSKKVKKKNDDVN